MPLHGVDPCWRCGDPEHWAAETGETGLPKCPWRYRAKDLAEHERRLQVIIDRFQECKISKDYKRELVKEEWELWRNRKSKGKAA